LVQTSPHIYTLRGAQIVEPIPSAGYWHQLSFLIESLCRLLAAAFAAMVALMDMSARSRCRESRLPLIEPSNKTGGQCMKTFIVDSFTNAPFKGNPAGVCIVEAELSDERMLHIAQELNLSETAFIQPLQTSGFFSIRFFSPKMEIALCGHATLAAAKVLFVICSHP
jgi:hypothetical protein